MQFKNTNNLGEPKSNVKNAHRIIKVWDDVGIAKARKAPAIAQIIFGAIFGGGFLTLAILDILVFRFAFISMIAFLFMGGLGIVIVVGQIIQLRETIVFSKNGIEVKSFNKRRFVLEWQNLEIVDFLGSGCINAQGQRVSQIIVFRTGKKKIKLEFNETQLVDLLELTNTFYPILDRVKELVTTEDRVKREFRASSAVWVLKIIGLILFLPFAFIFMLFARTELDFRPTLQNTTEFASVVERIDLDIRRIWVEDYDFELLVQGYRFADFSLADIEVGDIIVFRVFTNEIGFDDWIFLPFLEINGEVLITLDAFNQAINRPIAIIMAERGAIVLALFVLICGFFILARKNSEKN